MSVVARDRLVERVERYADRADDPTLPEVLGRFLLDPDEGSDERQVVEDVLARAAGDAPDAPGDTGDGEQGAASA